MFHVIYGEHCGATEAEANLWRTLAVQYINGTRDLHEMPMSLNALRMMLNAPAPCACRGDCIMEHSPHPDEMALCPHFER